MKKAIFENYGNLDTIKIIDAELPKLSSNEVLVKVKSIGLNPKDILVRKGKFKRFSGNKFPQSIGFEFSGLIEQSNGSDFIKGDKVFGMINGWRGRCCAEFVNVNINELSKAPVANSYEELAGIPLAGQTALQSIRDLGELKKGQKICINGASGGVGTLATQIAKEFGGIVTTISSSNNISLCESLGSDNAIAYDKNDVLKSQSKYDVFFDVFGNYSFSKISHLLNPAGKYITTVPKAAIFKEQFFNLFRKKKGKMIVVKSKHQDIKWLSEMIELGKIRPVVDKTFSLENIKFAQEYIESKRAKGKVIVNL